MMRMSVRVNMRASVRVRAYLDAAAQLGNLLCSSSLSWVAEHIFVGSNVPRLGLRLY